MRRSFPIVLRFPTRTKFGAYIVKDMIVLNRYFMCGKLDELSMSHLFWANYNAQLYN